MRTAVTVFALCTYLITYVAIPAQAYSGSLTQQNFAKMYYFAAKGDVRSLSSAISRGLNINATNFSGDTGLCVAVRNQNITAYKTFRAVGANPRPACSWRIPHFDQFVISHQMSGGSYYVQQTATPFSTARHRNFASSTGESISGGSNALYWIGGIALVGGGVALAAGGGGGGGDSCPSKHCSSGERCVSYNDCGGCERCEIDCSNQDNKCNQQCFASFGINICADDQVCNGDDVCDGKCQGSCIQVVNCGGLGCAEYLNGKCIKCNSAFEQEVIDGEITNTEEIIREQGDIEATWGGVYSQQQAVYNSGSITLEGNSQAVGIMSAASQDLTSAREEEINRAGGDINNSGDISITSGDSVGIFATTLGTIEGGELISLGTITNAARISLNGEANYGIELVGNGKIVNDGTIELNGEGSNIGILQHNGSVGYSTSEQNNIVNNGTISVSGGEGSYAIKADSADIINLNSITGDVRTDQGDISNSGEINGNVEARGTITNTSDAKITGDIKVQGTLNNTGEANITGNIEANEIENAAQSSIYAPDDEATITANTITNYGTIGAQDSIFNNIIVTGADGDEFDVNTPDSYHNAGIYNSGNIYGNIEASITDPLSDERASIGNTGNITGNISSYSLGNSGTITGNITTIEALTNNIDATINAGTNGTITAGKIINYGTIGSSDKPFTTITVTGADGDDFDRDDNTTYTKAALYNTGTIYGTTISVVNGTVVNDGEIHGNVVTTNEIIGNETISPAAAQAFALMRNARFINNGTISQSTEMNFDEMGDGTGEVYFGKDAVFEAPTVKGTAIATADHTTGSNEDSYTSSGNFVGDEVAVNIKSGTAMFNARANGSGVTMERIAFSDLLQDKGIAAYLESNYQSGNRVDVFDSLKQANDNNSLYDAARKALGQDFFPLLALQNQQRVRHFTHTMEDLVLDDDTLKSERMVAKFDSNYTEQDAANGLPGYDDKVYGISGLFDKEVSKHYRFGVGMGLYNAYAEFDDDDTRRDVIIQAYQTNRFEYNNWGALIMPYAGYSRGEYKHYANGGKYEPHFNIWNIGLNTRAYLKQDFGNWNFEPTLELNVSNIYQDKIKEDKNITINGVNSLSAEAGVGAYAKRKFDLGEDGKIEVKAGAMYYRELNNTAYDALSAQMYGMDGNYHISGYENDRNRTSLSLKADYKIGKWSVYGEVSQNFADNDNTVYNAGIRLAF